MDTPRGLEGRPSQSLTLAEASALLEAAESSRLHAFIVLCLLTGVRSEEARALTWEHVDLEAGTISVWRSVRAHGDTKTNRSRRTLKLPEIAVEALRGQRRRQAEERADAGEMWQEHGLVFTTSVGTGYESHNLRRDFRRVTAAAGLGARWVPKELRTSFVSMMSYQGVPVEEIARLAGHASSRTTEVIYRRELRPVITTGAEVMDQIFRIKTRPTSRFERRQTVILAFTRRDAAPAIRGGSEMPLLPPLVSPEELRDALGDERVRVFDTTVFLRRPVGGGPYTVESGRESYARAHIPGAGFADIPGALSDPASPFAFTLPAAEHFASEVGRLGIGGGTHVVAYAQDTPMWATRLWWLLRYFGHDDASVLDGGLAAWAAADGPVEPGESTYLPASFTARPRPELLASLDDVREISENGSACLVNALSPEAFRGQGPSAYSRPGRIPGSVNAPWNGLIDPATNRFRPPAELAAALNGGGVRADQPVIAYCGGGISATVDLFALWLTGRDDARLYDGSLTEWSAHPDLPLVIG